MSGTDTPLKGIRTCCSGIENVQYVVKAKSMNRSDPGREAALIGARDKSSASPPNDPSGVELWLLSRYGKGTTAVSLSCIIGR